MGPASVALSDDPITFFSEINVLNPLKQCCCSEVSKQAP